MAGEGILREKRNEKEGKEKESSRKNEAWIKGEIHARSFQAS